MFVEGREFLHIDQVGWVAKESTSEEDNRMSKVQEMLSEKTIRRIHFLFMLSN